MANKVIFLGNMGNVRIARKKPSGAVKIGETKSFRRYAKGSQQFVVAKPGFTLVRFS